MTLAPQNNPSIIYKAPSPFACNLQADGFE
ncbi:MAG: hypothetical protein JWP80_1868 [Pseudomonas sp.]|nr:hypothetical protein [Pseudomonas sp.]